MLGVTDWKTRVDPPTAACPEVWKPISPEGKTSPGNPTGANENYFTPWEIAGLAQRPVIFTLGCKTPQLW